MSSESDGESSNASSEDIYSKIFNRNLSESSDVGDITKLLANVAISDEKVETTNEIVQTLPEENASDSNNLNQNEQTEIFQQLNHHCFNIESSDVETTNEIVIEILNEIVNGIVKTLHQENTSNCDNLNQKENSLNMKTNKEHNVVHPIGENGEKNVKPLDIVNEKEDDPNDPREKLDSLISILTSDDDKFKSIDSVDDGKIKEKPKITKVVKKKKPPQSQL